MRILLFSDIHYTSDELAIPGAIVSVAAGDALGHTQSEKVAITRDWILAEHAKAPLDAVLMLGDLSIDDYDFRKLPENYCEKLKRELFDALPCPVFALAGNHDSYPDALWEAAVGTPRQYSIGIGGIGVLMLDTFASFPAAGASGSPYTGIDCDFVRRELEKFGDQPVIVCAHHIDTKEIDPAFAEILKTHPNVRALFRGHTHHNAVLDYAGTPLIDIGGIAYNGFCIDGKWTFGYFDEKWAWGYELLELDEAISLRHVKPPLKYVAENGTFVYPGEVSGILTIPR